MSLFVDIETSNLDPRKGVVFCVGLLNDERQTIHCYGENGEAERYILYRVAREVAQADATGVEVVTFSGRRFDFPFLNYRNAVHRFPKIKPAKHVDVQTLLPRQPRGYPASLEKSCKRYGISAKDTPFSESLWAAARLGDRAALKSIGQHCREDIISLRDLYYAITVEENTMEFSEKSETNTSEKSEGVGNDLPFLDDLNEEILDELDAVHQFEYEGATTHPDDPHPYEYTTDYQS